MTANSDIVEEVQNRGSPRGLPFPGCTCRVPRRAHSDVKGYLPGVALKEKSFDAILTKDFLHHPPDPMVLWSEARRLGRRSAVVYVMDLIRPANEEDARNSVETLAPNEHPILKEDFFNSLRAAFTVDEVAVQILRAEILLRVTQIGDRHMLIDGRLPFRSARPVHPASVVT